MAWAQRFHYSLVEYRYVSNSSFMEILLEIHRMKIKKKITVISSKKRTKNTQNI